MYIDTEGIILRQIKTVNGRRMVLLFSRKKGKISAGTSINEKGKSRSALAMRPFTFGRYQIYDRGGSYNINEAYAIKSYYRIGEDVDKFMCSSYVLELTEKFTAEEQPNPGLFNLLMDFFNTIEGRNRKYMTLVLAYEIKALDILGYMPETGQCICCGHKEKAAALDIREGGILCGNCLENKRKKGNDPLIYDMSFDIIQILNYFSERPLSELQNLALGEDKTGEIRKLLNEYIAFHLDIRDLKSEAYLTDK